MCDKRFTKNVIVDGNISYVQYFDYDVPICRSPVDVMNELAEETEQLKQQHRELQIEFNDACGIIHDLRESKLDLEDEIEQLKKKYSESLQKNEQLDQYSRDITKRCTDVKLTNMNLEKTISSYEETIDKVFDNIVFADKNAIQSLKKQLKKELKSND